MSRIRCRVSLWEGTDLTEREHEETHWHEDADGPWKVVLFGIKCVRAPGVRQDRLTFRSGNYLPAWSQVGPVDIPLWQQDASLEQSVAT